jgi:hypothetical protein
MKAPWKSGSQASDASSAVEVEPSIEQQLEPLVDRRSLLSDQLREINAKIAEKTDAVTRQLRAGDVLVANPVGIAELRQSANLRINTIATLSASISALEAERDEAAREAATAAVRVRLQQEFVAARDVAITARAAAHGHLRELVFGFPALMQAYRDANAQARAAASRAGQIWSPGDLFITVTQANAALELERLGTEANPRLFTD